MTTTPRWHERIEVFNNYYDYYISLDKVNNYDDLNYDEAKQIFNALKLCYEFYHKSLKDILNTKGISLFLPTDIFKKAQEVDLITDYDVWLDYIIDLNRYFQIYGRNEQKNYAIKILKKYNDKLHNVYKTLNSYYNANPCILRYETQELDYNSKPEYLSSDIGVSEYSYNILLNYFQSDKNIKYVWLHGSRAKGNARANSDIDLLIDIEACDVKTCKDNLQALPIPYRIDFVSINESQMKIFLMKNIPDSKIIYRKQDFD